METNSIKNLGDTTVPFASHLTSGSDEYLHCHGFIEIFYVLYGRIEHELNGVKETLETGDCRLLQIGTAHRFHRQEPSIHRDFIIRKDLYQEIGEKIDPAFFSSLNATPYRKISLSQKTMLFLEEQCELYYSTADVETKKRGERAIVNALLDAFYFSPSPEKESSFKTDCLNLISNFFDHKDAALQIRLQTGYNEKYFCKKFKEDFGETLIDHLNKRRMEYAKYLLKVTNESISSIASRVGIESASHFHHLYKNAFGETPAKTRKSQS